MLLDMKLYTRGMKRRQWRLFTDVVHMQELVCALELAVQTCSTYTRCDHAWLPGESASDAWHVGAVGAGHGHPIGEDEDWAM